MLWGSLEGKICIDALVRVWYLCLRIYSNWVLRCIIVDSTRRGKSMPDALSKTVAIWIAVLNRVLFPEEIESHILQTPENVISRSEHAQIETRLSNFVPELRGLRIDMNSLCTKLQGKPLEPLWVTPDTLLPNSPLQRTDRNLVVLCTASGRTNYEPSMSDYVQGAADDSESWALGMDPATFWKHNAQLLSSSEDELPEVISTLDAGARLDVPVRSPVLIKPTSNIWIANNSTAELLHADFDVVVSCSEKPNDVLVQKLKGRYIHLHCTTGKVGSRQLRHEMPKLSRFTRVISSATRILVACQTGRDLAVGAALAIICLYCSEHGTLRSVDSSGRSVELNKAIIKHRLSWIMVSMPDASPSRATLQSVNAFLLG